MIKYRFVETEKIRGLLIEAEALKIVFDNLKVLPQIEENFRRNSLLKSSVYSARVEGNPATMDNAYDQDRIHKLEITNLVRAYKFIYSKNIPKNLSVYLIKKSHEIVMKDLSSFAGHFRIEPWAIFNEAGVAVFLAPAHFKVPGLVRDLVNEIKKTRQSIFVKSAVFQFLFEKIHPFPDGNGRVGRLISSYLMNIGGYGFRGLIPMEEIIDNERESYYEALEPSRDATLFVEFFLESFIRQAKKVLEAMNNSDEPTSSDLLPPRRKEIVEIVKNHPYATFDLLSRRFLKVNPKTLHYDLKKLIDDNFVVKIGKTKGVSYLIKK
jgi:Fic family protein